MQKKNSSLDNIIVEVANFVRKSFRKASVKNLLHSAHLAVSTLFMFKNFVK